MNDLRLIALFVISSLIGTLGGACITLLPLFIFMFAVGDAGHIGAGSAFVFFILFVIEFILAGALTAIMMRSFVGSHIISVKEGVKRFTIGSVIGGLLASASLSIEEFFGAMALGIVITYAIGGTLCWRKMKANEREMGPETIITLNLRGQKKC
jgi:hypothetical protein